MAVFVQQITQPHMADHRRQVAADHPVEKLRGSVPGDLETVEAGHLHDADALLQPPDLCGYDVVGRVETVAGNILEVVTRLEEQRAFPAVDHAPLRLELVEHRVERRRSGQPRLGSVFVGQVVVEFGAIVFDGLEAGVFGVGVLRESARIQAPCIPLAFAVHDQLRQHLAVPAAFADAGTQADVAIGVGTPGTCPTSGRPSMV